MTETSVTVDLARLRAVADRVERCSQALAQLDCPGLDPAELAGSRVGGVADPAPAASALPGVFAAVQRWADAARASATAFADADRDNATRL